MYVGMLGCRGMCACVLGCLCVLWLHAGEIIQVYLGEEREDPDIGISVLCVVGPDRELLYYHVDCLNILLQQQHKNMHT